MAHEGERLQAGCIHDKLVAAAKLIQVPGSHTDVGAARGPVFAPQLEVRRPVSRRPPPCLHHAGAKSPRLQDTRDRVPGHTGKPQE